MYARIAYLGVIIMWSTTPLAVKWSSEGAGYLFAVTSRMVLGLVFAWLIMRAMRQVLPLHTRALQTYLVSGLNVYLSMTCVYWASQYIPSGWISVVFGLSPIMTGAMAVGVLGENLSPYKLCGMVMGVIGLVVIFGHGYASGYAFVAGIIAVLFGTLSHSVAAVMIKKLQARVSGTSATTGGLAVATPLFLATWYLFDGSLPEMISSRALYAIIYLGVFASTVGFAMYFYILAHMDVQRVSLVTLITPVCALVMGNMLNNEPVGADVIMGTGFIVTGLLFYEYGRRLAGLVFRIGPAVKRADPDR